MAISKVVYKSSSSATPVTWMDATSATASASDITSPKTAMLANGVMTTGTGGGGVGIEVVKGTFTVYPDQIVDNTYTINFGKTFSKYLYLIEMTEESKTTLLSSGQTSDRMYSCMGTYPIPQINNITPSYNFLSVRVKPSTSSTSVTAPSSSSGVATSSTITFPTSNLNGANQLYRNYSYNYTIVSLDNV